MKLLSLAPVFRTITLFLALFFFNQSVSLSQCSPGAPDCSDSPIIGFPFNTRMLSDINGSGEIPGCNGQGFFHNTTWYRIIPTTPFIFIDIIGTNCTTVGGNQGLQLGLYPVCDPNATPVGTIQCDCAAPGQIVTLGGVVVPGEPYYIMVDGCSGSTCDLNMTLTTGAVEPPTANLGVPAAPITSDPIPTCPGAVLTFTVPPVTDADVYTWIPPPGTTIISQECNTVTVEWGPVAGNISVNVTSNVTGQVNPGPPTFVPIDPPMYSLTAEYCSPTPGGYVFFGDGATYTEGIYDLLIPGPICDTAVQLTVIENLIAVDFVIEVPAPCNAGNNNGSPNFGEASIFMQNNGATSFNFQWENSSISGPTNNQLMVGTTRVTITDDRGCSMETSVNITEPPFLFADVNIDVPPSCENAADGRTVVFAQGGTTATGQYSYEWSDGSTEPNRTDLTAGVHELVITDDNGCIFTWIGLVEASGGNVTATESNQSGESCTGSEDGSVTLTGDGAGTFTFTWPDGSMDASRTDLAAGDYEVTIENGTGCSGTQIVNIAEGNSFTVDASDILNVRCFNETNGMVTVDVTGATGIVNYNLGIGTVTGNVISDLPAGNYTLTVTDGSGCESETPIEITEPTEFLPTIANIPVSCGGSGDGSATVTPIGGTGPYTYLWGDGETTPSIVNLSGGTFTVDVMDANGCTVPLSTDVDGGGSLGVLADPANTQLTVSCPGDADGMISVIVSGNTGNVTYVWTGNTTSTSETAAGLEPGIYSVVATDAQGCFSAPFEVTVVEPDPIIITEMGITQTSCVAGTDGTAEVSVSGGTGTNYTFQWSNGETTNPAVGLGPGDNTVTVMDQESCTQTLIVTVPEPLAITATIDPVDPRCFGDANGSITINASGGSGDYIYEVVGDANGPQPGTTNEFVFLGPDTYTITVSNMDGSCSEIFTETLVEQAEITATIASSDVTCAGFSNGGATITANGGFGNYTYQWSGSTETSATISGQSGGGLFVTVTDDNMCTQVFSTVIVEPNPIIVTLDAQTDANCDGLGGGTATVNVSGGDGDYTFTWSAGTPNDNQATDLNMGDVTVEVVDNSGCESIPFVISIGAPEPVTLLEDQVNPETCFEEANGSVTVMTNGGNGPFEFELDGNGTPQNSNVFTDLSPGNHTVDVTDVNGCTDMITINIPAAVEILGNVDVSSVRTICDGTTDGSLIINASGGDGDLMYVLNNGAPQTSNIFNDLSGGTFTIEIRDGNNCSISLSGAVDELPEISTDIDLATSFLTVCDGGVNGSVTIDASGGDGDLMFTANGITQSSNVFTDLSGGTYPVLVEDGNGCTANTSFTVMELMPITIDLDAMTSDLIVCSGENDGNVTITASGGDNNLTYSIPGITQNNGVFTDLAPDTYTVTVMDGNMCSNTFDFTVDTAPAITGQVDIAASELDVCDGEDGSVTIIPGGGDNNYTFTLGTDTQTSPTFNDLPANNYTIIIEDGNGCSEPVDFTVTAAAPISANISASDLNVCNGFTDGSVTIAASGGNGDFTFTLGADTQTNPTFDNLAPGPHTVLITDGNGCTTTPIDFTVNEGAAINASLEVAASDLLVCDGFSDGSITINASGGTGNLVYSIDTNPTPQTSNEFTNLGEGDYTIMITDADGCISMPIPVSIAAADPVIGVIDPVSNLSICNGETIGSVTINGSGGDGNLTYTLNPGAISQSSNVFNDLPAGLYTIDIADGNNCTTTPVDFMVEEAPALTAVVDPNSDLINCFGASDGSITINAGGGNGGLMYEIVGGPGPQASNTFNGLAPGDYSIIVTDINNCPSAPVDLTVVEAPALDGELTLTSSDLTVCSGDADGVASIAASGGDGDYTYSIDGSPTSQASNIFENLAEGDHIVTIVDGNGCDNQVQFTVAPAPEITFTTDITNVSCFGEPGGQAVINVTGGEGPFDFVWSNAQVTETAQLLIADTYTVTITDANMCEVIETVTITEPASALVIDNINVVIEPATCGDTNGSVSIQVSGGTGTYNYIWSDDSTNPDLTAVGPGSYTVTIIDANMCEVISQPFNVSEPGALEVTPSSVPVACNGDNTGSISLDVQGGTGPYTFAWADDPNETTGIRNELFQGSYSVEVSDADGCILPEISINISEPEPITTTLTPTQASCGASDGSVSLLVDGGTGVGTYSYAWSVIDGGTTISIDPNLTDVPAGDYEVMVTDQNNCSVVSLPITVTNPGTPDLAIAGVDVTCFGASTGSIMLDINGGSGGNTIDWGVNSDLNGLTNPTNLPAGEYFVTVTDMSMCEASIMITIDEPAAPIEITEIQINQATCGDANGSVVVDVTGGTGNYTFNWSDGSGTTTVSGLSPGIVTLEIIDQNMCSTTASYNVSEPNALQVDIDQTFVSNVSCNGTSTGSIDVSVIGGTGPGTYTYLWDNDFGANEDLTNLPAGDYTLLITDGDGCEFNYFATVEEPDELSAVSTAIMANCGQSNGGINVTVSGGTEPYNFLWTDGTTNEDLSNAPAGTNTLVIRDANMCEFTLTDEIVNPNPPVIDLLFTDATCNGTATGTATVNVSGGSGVYTYDWNFNPIDGQNNPTNLPAGDYEVTVSDNLNCSAVEIFTVLEPMPLVLDIEEVIEATCGEANGSVAIGITGGTQPYNFDWNNGLFDTEDIQNLTPGTYDLDFMDANGCTLTESFVVSEPNALTVVAGPVSQVDCPGGDNGSIQVIAEGGSGPGTYTFLWSNGDTDAINDNLTADTYTVTVMDTDGCSFEFSQTISEPDPIMINGTTVDAVCGQSNGSIALNVTGGTGDYTYQWDNGAAPVQNPGGLGAGQYNVTVTDQNNCIAEPFSIAVTSPNAPVVDFTSTPVSCNGGSDGTINLTVTGGNGIVEITWSDPDIIGTSVNDLAAGVYNVVAEDEDGCTFPVTITIDEPQLLEAFVVDPQSSTLCNGSADGLIDLVVQGGTGTFSFQWTNGAAPVEDPENLLAGIYDVVVTDDNGCTATESVIISEPDAITLSADPSSSSCNNTADGAIDVSVAGGTGEFTFELNGNLIEEEDLTDLQPGDYTLVTTDQNGCNETILVTVDAPAPIVVNLANESDFNGFNTSCNGSEDGFLTASAQGGNAGFSYLWVDGTTEATIADIPQGSYNVIVTDQEGCTGENTFSIDGPDPITLDVGTDEPDCFGENNGVIMINDVQGGRLPYRYSLDNGDFTSAQFFGNLPSGSYNLVVEDANGCTNDTEVIVDQVPEITVSINDDPVEEILLGDSFSINAQSSIGLDSNFVWSVSGFLGDTLEGTTEIVRPLSTTSYSITVTDEFGCSASDELLLQVNNPRLVAIPNAFNPNSTNSLNQTFTISGGQDVSIVRSIDIYNRWGEVVFSARDFPTDDPTEGSWDGDFRNQEAQSGVYVYIVTVEFIDGFSETYTGDITLLR